MYSKSTEALIRQQLDPDFLLPHVWLQPMRPDAQATVAAYGIARSDGLVGRTTLRRLTPDVGHPAMLIDELVMERTEEAQVLRQAAAITILATCLSEDRMLVSSPRSSGFDEAAMWLWFARHEIATVTKSFTPRLDPEAGYPVFDGRAFAVPDHIDRLGAISKI